MSVTLVIVFPTKQKTEITNHEQHTKQNRQRWVSSGLNDRTSILGNSIRHRLPVNELSRNNQA